MAKGFFTQGVAVLLREPVSIEQVQDRLRQFNIVNVHESAEDWQFGGPTVLIAFRPEVNGYIAVDVVDHAWPDHMGDPESEATLFGAWAMGHFGPFAYPGSLERAAQQSWDWPDGKTMPAVHKAFLRVRCSYGFDANSDSLVIPENYQPVPELLFVTKIVRALLDLPQALCYFNPNAECLASTSEMDVALQQVDAADPVPLEIWSNIRMFRLEDHQGWILMDTVGMSQLDVMDHEALFPDDTYNPNDVAGFLRGLSSYLVSNGSIINSGDTADGPEEKNWKCTICDDSFIDPPRRVFRWLPQDGQPVPEGLQHDKDQFGGSNKPDDQTTDDN